MHVSGGCGCMAMPGRRWSGTAAAYSKVGWRVGGGCGYPAMFRRWPKKMLRQRRGSLGEGFWCVRVSIKSSMLLYKKRVLLKHICAHLSNMSLIKSIKCCTQATRSR